MATSGYRAPRLGTKLLILMSFALVVIADRETDLAHASMEIEGLAQQLLRRSRIEVD